MIPLLTDHFLTNSEIGDRHGYFSARVDIFNINNNLNNFNKHLSDFDYYKLHPLNGKYSKWIDDKLTMKYLLHPFNDFMPQYYYHLSKYGIHKLSECPPEINNDIDGIYKLLKIKNRIVIKKVSGSQGKGFQVVEYLNSSLYINNKITKVSDFDCHINSLNDYLITEYVTSHSTIRDVYSLIPNTLRIQVMRNKNEIPFIASGFMRFGTNQSGYQETSAAGSIFTKVDLDSGQLSMPSRIINNKLEKLKTHPETGKSLDIKLPNYNELVEVIYQICDYLPQLRYMGFDIIIISIPALSGHGFR
jgi:hypothetical protein